MSRKKHSKVPAALQETKQKDWGLIALLLIPASLLAAPFMCGNMNFYALALPLYFALFGAYLYFGNKRVKEHAEFAPFLIISFLALLVYSLGVLLFFSSSRYASALSVITLMSLAGLVCIVSCAAKKPDFALYTALGVFAGAALTAVRGTALALATDGSRLFAGGIPRIFGTFVNPNFFAGYLVLAVPIGIALIFIFAHKQLRIILSVCLFFVISALLLTGSKFGFAALLLSLACFALMAFPARKLMGTKGIIAVAVMFAVAFGIFGWGLVGRVSEAQEGGSQVHSTEFRILTWKSSIKMALDNPILGVGPGRFEEAYPRYADAGLTTHAHNSYLQFADEYGIPCFLIPAGWLVISLIFGLLTLKHPERLPEITLGECRKGSAPLLWAGLEAGLFGLLCHAMADSDLHIGASCLACAVISGILLSAAPKKKEAPAYAKAVLERCVLLCLLVIFVFGFSDWCTHTKRYETALRMVPINGKAWMGYAEETESIGMVKTRLKNARRETPEDFQVYLRLGALAQAEGSDECIELYKQALRLHPHSITAMKRLAEYGEAKGNNKLADTYYQKILDMESSTYEQIKGVPEMVNTAYCDAHRYFAAKSLVEENEKAAEEHLRASCNRYALQLENKDYLIVSLVNGLMTLGELEDNEDKYIGDVRMLGDLTGRNTTKEESDIADKYKAVTREYSRIAGQ